MKARLDDLLIQRDLASSIKEAQALIGAGQVYVNDTCSDKAGSLHNIDVRIRIKERCKFVSRGGLKLDKALSHFRLDVSGMVCADIGASSGGFTDCLLQRGASRIFAVDVAYGQFSWKLRQDPRVDVLERFNARHLTANEIPVPLDLTVIDASFISLTTLIPPILPLFGKEIRIIALIKPQFELPRNMVENGGVVTQSKSHQYAIDSVVEFSLGHGMKVVGVVESPVLGPKGNREFLVYFTGAPA